MSVAFWSTPLKTTEPVEIQPPEGYVLNITQAALTGKGSLVIKVSTISIEGDELVTVIGTLREQKSEQFPLSLVFGYDVPTKFSVTGDASATAYLSGYYQPAPNEDDDEDDEDGPFGRYGEDDEDEDDEDEDSEQEDVKDTKKPVTAAKPAVVPEVTKAKVDPIKDGKKDSKMVVEDAGDDEEDSDDDEDEDEDDVDEEFVTKMIKQAELEQQKAKKAPGKPVAPPKHLPGVSKAAPAKEESDDDDDDDDEDDDSEGDSDSDDDEDVPPAKIVKNIPQGKVITPFKTNNQQQNNKPKTPQNQNQNQGQKGPQSGNKPNNNNNNNNKTPNQKGPGGNNFNSNQKSGNKPQFNNNKNSGDKRKRDH
eukprot:gene7165-9768_t